MSGDPTFNGFAGNQYNYYHSLGRPISHYITADSEEEEAEYAQFADIKRSNFLPQENIHHDYKYWHDLGQVACERMLKKGTVRTERGMESQCIAVLYSGDKVKEAWKRDFQQVSGIPSVEMVHVVAINRTKIPFPVLEGGTSLYLAPLEYRK
ncbi:hypothetical protein V5O48_015122 [Marasmius crinis-equi]|uniref:Uncharacterized protein n=1 Tax=Marasmius crinis-equi TaxID=585013 RepID=A0ABR3EVG6_9AGAR